MFEIPAGNIFPILFQNVLDIYGRLFAFIAKGNSFGTFCVLNFTSVPLEKESTLKGGNHDITLLKS